ncbi:MAG: histidine kinase [Bacteroidales bacterium]|nr:histidine kinase [Bacteroidales bacterium]
MIALNLLYVRWFSPRFEKKLLKNGKKGKSRQIAVLAAFILGVALLETVLTGILPFRKNPEFQHDFPILFVTSVIIEIAVYCLVYMINYALKAGNEVKEAIGLANVAQYRYFKLKHQVNPHFLFNSLNILDCLVCEQKTEEASTYIHKLAGLYRYMLKTEDTQLVTLQDELDFASRYIELLLVRFPEGLKVITDIPEDSLKRNVVPCSLQLLIENATKHNAISREHPLIIKISATDGHIKVSNEIIPKISQSPSSGLGLKYMRQQYFDLSGKDIDIQHTDNTFTVTIPLI